MCLVQHWAESKTVSKTYSFRLLAQPFCGECFRLSFFFTYLKSFHFTLDKLPSIQQSLLIRGTNLCQHISKNK